MQNACLQEFTSNPAKSRGVVHGSGWRCAARAAVLTLGLSITAVTPVPSRDSQSRRLYRGPCARAAVHRLTDGPVLFLATIFNLRKGPML